MRRLLWQKNPCLRDASREILTNNIVKAMSQATTEAILLGQC